MKNKNSRYAARLARRKSFGNLTASASQNREPQRKALETCVHALMDVQKAYQDMFDVMPVAWQTYDDIVADALDAAGVLDTGERKVTAKPADAHAAGAHTPKDNDHNLKFYSEREHIRQQNETSAWQAEALEVDLLRGKLAETAAERDRLREAIMTTEAVRLQETHRAIKAEGERDRLKWEMDGYREVATQLESPCDLAREQVKTLENLVAELQEQLNFMQRERDCLLAACRRYKGRSKAIVLTGDRKAWEEADREFQAAIASVESEQAKERK